MTNVTDLNSSYNKLRRFATQSEKHYAEIHKLLGEVVDVIPNELVLKLGHYSLDKWLGIAAKSWQAATRFRFDTRHDTAFSFSAESILLGQDPKPVAAYTGNHLKTQWVTPVVDWESLKAVLDHYTTTYADVVQPVSVFIYAPFRYFVDNGWALIIFSAKPGDMAFKYTALSPDMKYIVDADINYNTIPEDSKALEEYAKGGE